LLIPAEGAEPYVRGAFGANVRRLRERMGIKQVSFAHACNLDPGYIGRIESGGREPAFRAIVEIAAALRVPIMTLFWSADASPPDPGGPTEAARLPVGDAVSTMHDQLDALAASCRRLRASAGLSQGGLAQAAGVKPDVVAAIERNEGWPGILGVAKVAKVLRVSVAVLFAGLDCQPSGAADQVDGLPSSLPALGANIRRHRFRAGISRPALATAVGMTFVSWGEVERGRVEPDLCMVITVLQTLRVSITALLEDPLQIFAGNLRRARTQAAMTLAELGRTADVKLQLLSRIEQGEREPGLRAIVTIAAALNVSISDLFKGIGALIPPPCVM
jgi:transcriptional regulator with XRE-family HTH domain